MKFGYKKTLTPETAVNVPDQDQLCEILDRIFMHNGVIVPVYAKFAESLPVKTKAAYCHHRGIYGLITHELVDWLREEIGDAVAIEIGSGNGTLGRALGIPTTDDCQQRDIAEFVEAYEAQGQPLIQYPDDIEKLDALAAVDKYKPTVVIGSWITHRYERERHEYGGNMYGVDENQMMRMGVRKYIMLGNEKSHWGKPLFKNKSVLTTKIKRDFYFSRSLSPDKDVIYKFTKKLNKKYPKS